jgi:uncharacterized ion transporter superfamily protein YfcC
MAKSKKNGEVELILEDPEELQTSDKENAEVNKKPKQKSVLTLFLFLFPILLLAYSKDFIIKLGLFIYVAVLLQNYISDQYQKKESI